VNNMAVVEAGVLLGTVVEKLEVTVMILQG